MDNAARILLLGKTGVGKSSFINYFVGKQGMAKAGKGRPVTQEYFIPYAVPDGDFPLEIFDTKGLEDLHAHSQLDEIISGIKERNGADDIFDWFHTIFYCVSMASSRFQDFEADFICRLQSELLQHIHIILTHCDYANSETIADMKANILKRLNYPENVEIFEVTILCREGPRSKQSEGGG